MRNADRMTIGAIASVLLLAGAAAAAEIPPLPDDPFEPIRPEEIELAEEETAELEELWETARSWGVGALQEKVPAARAELAERSPGSVKFLLGKLDDEYSLALRAFEIIFGKIGAPAVEPLAAQLPEGGEAIRKNVIRVLSGIKHQAAADALAAFVEEERRREEPDEKSLYSAIAGLSTLGDPRAVPLIQPYAGHEKESRRLRYCIVMERFAPQEGYAPLLPLLRDEFFSVRYSAQEALQAIGEPAVEALLVVAASDDPIGANHAVMALGEIGSREAWSVLKERLLSESWAARGFAAEAMSRINARRAERVFARRLPHEEHPFVLHKLAEAEERAGGGG